MKTTGCNFHSRSWVWAAVAWAAFLQAGCGNFLVPKHRVSVDAICAAGVAPPAGQSFRLVARKSSLAQGQVNTGVMFACVMVLMQLGFRDALYASISVVPRQLDGDIFIQHENGYFQYQSRSDDMIISSGYNVAAPEVENALLTHQAVMESAVVGLPDEERGMIVTAYVVLRPGFIASDELKKELQDHVKSTIVPFKYPRSLHFVETLPKTTTGKLQRFRLKV